MHCDLMSILELLQANGKIIDQLMALEVTTTRDNPVGGYVEWLVCGGLGLRRMPNSHPGFDGIDEANGHRYQIKSRRSEEDRPMLGGLKGLRPRGFDTLVAVILHEDYTIRHAIAIPYDMIRTQEGEIPQNGYNLFLSEPFLAEILAQDRDRDIRSRLLPVQEEAIELPQNNGVT